jgi:hypothetical protein
MSWATDKERILVWLCVSLLTAMVSILSWMGSSLWADGVQGGKDISELKANRINDHDAILETRDTVKQLARDVQELLKRVQ